MIRAAELRLGFFLSLAAAACLLNPPEGPAAENPAAAPAGEAGWPELLKRRPYPYRLPLPESRPSAVDGTYAKRVPAAAGRVHCRRCPDYAPEAGKWRLQLDRGSLRIFHPETGWKSLASFFVAGDRLLLANDPNCIDALGLYHWRLTPEGLELGAIDDPCAIGLRAANLGQMPWSACRPPDAGGPAKEGWTPPEGCE